MKITITYRMIDTSPNLLEQAIHGGLASSVSGDDLLRIAYAIIRSDYTERASSALKESKEKMSPARFSTDLEAILSAAVNGRVSRLYVDERPQKLGFDH